VSRASAPVPIAARIVLVVLALVVCAWFALGVRAFKDENAADASITVPGAIAAAQARADRALLEEARVLNPDQNVDLIIAQLDARTGDRPAALTIAHRVARSEPENVNAWLLITELAPRSSAAYRQAAAHARLLAPPVPQ